MSINGEAFYEHKKKQFGMQASHVKFTEDYIRAVNYATDRIGIELHLDSMPTRITDVGTDIDLDSDYEIALNDIVDYRLIGFGHRRGDLDLKTAESFAKESIGLAMLRRDLDSIDADNDDVIADLDTTS